MKLDENQRESFLTMQFKAQQQDYEKRFPDRDHRVILLGDLPIGHIHLTTSDQEIRILDVALTPDHRNKGLGASLITDLLKQAAETHKCVRVYVERFNPALRLFERLGFASVADIGTHYLLESPDGLD